MGRGEAGVQTAERRWRESGSRELLVFARGMGRRTKASRLDKTVREVRRGAGGID